jgi:mitochondrial fission protein ELM1
MIKALKVCLVSDGTDSIAQSREVALRLAGLDNITRLYKDDAPEPAPHQPDLAIGVGFNVTDTLVKMKESSGGKTKIAVILDPLAHYEKFDFIILPSYEPYKVPGNILWTKGLINFVNRDYLALKKAEFEAHEKYRFLRDKKLQGPYLLAIIGGRHTGGNIDEEDATTLAEKINSIIAAKGGTALISTSRRTELKVSEVLRNKLKVPYFLYDYKLREIENPYGVFLAMANEIIVTGESVRMMSECCSSGAKVRIYRPRQYGFQYKPLIDEFISNKHAVEFDFDEAFTPAPLDEAARVATIIKNSL